MTYTSLAVDAALTNEDMLKGVFAGVVSPSPPRDGGGWGEGAEFLLLLIYRKKTILYVKCNKQENVT